MRRISRAVKRIQYNNHPFPTPSGLILESQMDKEWDTELAMLIMSLSRDSFYCTLSIVLTYIEWNQFCNIPSCARSSCFSFFVLHCFIK